MVASSMGLCFSGGDDDDDDGLSRRHDGSLITDVFFCEKTVQF